VTIVIGLDQHRAQITVDWPETETGEVKRARVAPADRAAVRRFSGRFRARSWKWRLRRRPAGGSWWRSCAGSALVCISLSGRGTSALRGPKK